MSAAPPAAARDRILDAADEVFGAVGFAAATTRQIAAASGATKALIHYHFKTKDGLLEALLDRYYQALGATLQGALAGAGDLRARTLALVDRYLDFLRRHRNFARIVQRQAAGGPHQARIREHMAPLLELGTRVVQAAYPTTRGGDLAAGQLLITGYGILVTAFTYADLAEPLLGADPYSEEGFAARRRHVRRAIRLLFDAVEAVEADEAAAGGGEPW